MATIAETMLALKIAVADRAFEIIPIETGDARMTQEWQIRLGHIHGWVRFSRTMGGDEIVCADLSSYGGKSKEWLSAGFTSPSAEVAYATAALKNMLVERALEILAQ